MNTKNNEGDNYSASEKIDLLERGERIYGELFVEEEEDMAIAMNTTIKFDDIEVAKTMVDIEDDIGSLMDLAVMAEELDMMEDRILLEIKFLDEDSLSIKDKFDEIRSVILKPEAELMKEIFGKIKSGCKPHEEAMVDTFCGKWDYSKHDLKHNMWPRERE
jgi:hypothetical protein